MGSETNRRQRAGVALLSESRAACSRIASTCVMPDPVGSNRSESNLAAQGRRLLLSWLTDFSNVLLRQELEVVRRGVPVHKRRSQDSQQE